MNDRRRTGFVEFDNDGYIVVKRAVSTYGVFLWLKEGAVRQVTCVTRGVEGYFQKQWSRKKCIGMT